MIPIKKILICAAAICLLASQIDTAIARQSTLEQKQPEDHPALITLANLEILDPPSESPTASIQDWRFQEPLPQKRSTRAIWLQTISSEGAYPETKIDQSESPEKKAEAIVKQKQELIDFLNVAESLNVNTIFFQVRPSSDAFYRSEFLPWSIYLFNASGKQGVDPGWDPLAFIIQEAHSRNIDLHAWCNPYRIGSKKNISRYAENNIRNLHPEWVTYSNNVEVVDPGIPEARIWVEDTIMEIVRNYDIDGIHFDDYFYYESNYGDYDTYPENGFQKMQAGETSFDRYNQLSYINGRPDLPTGQKAFAHTETYPLTPEGKQAWRENNVNLLIKELRTLIDAEKPWVQFGVGPAGVWANQKNQGDIPGHPDGSDTKGGATTKYCHAADTLLWAKEGWIDYIAPQAYWSFSFDRANHGVVMDWWAEQLQDANCRLYTGSTLSKVNDLTQTDPTWHGAEGIQEIQRQLRFAANRSGISGNVLWSRGKLTAETGLFEMIQSEWREPSIPETMPWKNAPILEKPDVHYQKNGDQFILTLTPASEQTTYYLLYAFPTVEAIDLSDPSYIIGKYRAAVHAPLQPVAQTIEAPPSENKVFVITALDRLHNESDYVLLDLNTI